MKTYLSLLSLTMVFFSVPSFAKTGTTQTGRKPSATGCSAMVEKVIRSIDPFTQPVGDVNPIDDSNGQSGVTITLQPDKTGTKLHYVASASYSQAKGQALPTNYDVMVSGDVNTCVLISVVVAQ